MLADIEWWRVTDGQCEPSAGDQGLEDHNTDDDQNIVGGPVAGVTFLDVDIGVEHLSWPPTIPVSSTEVRDPVALGIEIVPDLSINALVSPYACSGYAFHVPSSILSSDSLSRANCRICCPFYHTANAAIKSASA